ncbi:MAG TPA: hypothetical protein VF179_28255, partial [Thermoanaerobaculia bacterium]|nr:hypothetical protein [Thermoanaerobaculia bacterium]
MATVRFVSALYRGTFPNGTEQVDLRVDIEGDSSDTHRLSGDIFEVEGSRRAFSSSFIVDLPTPAAGPSQLI